MSKVIGIDLGTTNSAAGLKTLKTEIISNAEGDPLTPSVVSYQAKKGFLSKEKFIVGKHALEWLAQDPENTIISIKRLMGRNVTDEEVQKFINEKHFAYTVKPLSRGSTHSVAVLLNGKEYTPEQISAKILEKVRTDCEKQIKESVEYAVVTVPAYFNDKQKHATRMAATLAGIKVQRLLPEPTAAAISFGVDNLAEGEAKTILVYDFGGGTFDISILTIADGQFIEQSKGGDMWMGGDDIDNIISQSVYQKTQTEYEIDNLPDLIDRLPSAEKNRFLSDLKQKVEAAKVQLSTRDKAHIEILGLLKDEEGDILDIEVELTREQFEALILPFVERSIALTKQVIEGVNFDLELIDKVVMVGGSSCIPLVVQKVKELFGDDRVLVHERPMLAIAEGAAILAHRLADTYECPACGHEVSQSDEICSACQFNLMEDLSKTGVVDIVHSTSHDYYLELEDGSGYLLAERNTPLPFKTQASFKLMHVEQRLAHFKFYNMVNDIKESIGDLWLSFDLDASDVKQDEVHEVSLEFEIDENNIITVSASLKDLPDIKVSRTLSRGNVDERFFLDLEQSIARVNREKRDYYAAHDFLTREIKIANKINRIIDPDTGEENTNVREHVEMQQDVANKLVERNEAPLSNIFFAEDFVTKYRQFFSDKDRTTLEKKLELLKDRNERGSVDEILKARDELSDELDEHPGLIALKSVENAADIVSEENPAKAPRFEKYLHDIHEALFRKDRDTFKRLMTEIMPEVHTTLQNYGKKDLHIWKEIRK